jgi:peptidyl-prolyl cis-trans isomerase C
MAVSLLQRASIVGVVMCASGLASSCGDDGAGRGPGRAERGESQVGGAVVSTVNGHPILISDVHALMKASSLSAREALERLQAEQLLIAEAERRGIASATIDHVAERARVQALLDREAAANVATESDLRTAYEKDVRFHMPEMRLPMHVLARVSTKATEAEVAAARAVAVKAIADLRSLDLAAIEARYSADATIDGVKVKTERLPPVHRDSAFLKEFLEGVFSVSATGVVPEPVRTRFGWHAIRVLEITAPRHTPFEQAEKVLRTEVTTKKQAEAVSALLIDLRHANPVKLVPDADEKLSSIDGADAFRSR